LKDNYIGLDLLKNLEELLNVVLENVKVLNQMNMKILLKNITPIIEEKETSFF
jgi:hypothetical protein